MGEEALRCENCGRLLEPEARYCMECGRPVLRPGMEWGDENTAILRRVFDRKERPPFSPRPVRSGRLKIYQADGRLLNTVEIPQDRPLRIGRGSDQDVRLMDMTVSRSHAVIEYQGGFYILRDMGSTNATLLNGEPISQPEVLFHGAEITIGTHILIFEEG